MKIKQKKIKKYDFCFYKQDLQFVAIWQHWDNEKQNRYFFLLYKIFQKWRFTICCHTATLGQWETKLLFFLLYKIFLKRRNTTSMINKVSLINEIIFLKKIQSP